MSLRGGAMVTKLKDVDVVVGRARLDRRDPVKELAEAGLKVVALERGSMRRPRRIIRSRTSATSCATSCATT
jgi:hypothetical protein